MPKPSATSPGPVGDAVAGHFTGTDQLNITVVERWTSPKLITFGKKGHGNRCRCSLADSGGRRPSFRVRARTRCCWATRGWDDIFHPTADAALELYMFAGAKGLVADTSHATGSLQLAMLMPMELEELLPQTSENILMHMRLQMQDMDALLSGHILDENEVSSPLPASQNWTTRATGCSQNCLQKRWCRRSLPRWSPIKMRSSWQEMNRYTGMMITLRDAGIGLC